jgi:hypothetical protein
MGKNRLEALVTVVAKSAVGMVILSVVSKDRLVTDEECEKEDDNLHLETLDKDQLPCN